MMFSEATQNRNSTYPIQSPKLTQDTSWNRSHSITSAMVSGVDGNNQRLNHNHCNRHQYSILENAIMLGLIRFPLS